MNNAIIDAACISTQNECVKKKNINFFLIKKSIMNFSESRQNRSRENREKSKNCFEGSSTPAKTAEKNAESSQKKTGHLDHSSPSVQERVNWLK